MKAKQRIKGVLIAALFMGASLAWGGAGDTTRVSVSSSGVEGDDNSYQPTISADGRYIVFQSYADNLVSGDTNGKLDIFIRDRQTDTTTRVSVKSDGTESNDNSAHPTISADGRYVAFHSDATNLVDGDTNGKTDVFVYDRQTHTTTRVSVKSNGTQNKGKTYSSKIY